MGRHQEISNRSRRTRSLVGGFIGGVVGAGALMSIAPAGLAFADDVTPGQLAGGRPDLTYPAPVVRGAQKIQDSLLDPNGNDVAVVANARAKVNDSTAGELLHLHLGYSAAGATAYNERHDLEEGDEGYLEASNGVIPGTFVTQPKLGQVYAQTVNIHECQVKRDSETGRFTGISESC